MTDASSSDSRAGDCLTAASSRKREEVCLEARRQERPATRAAVERRLREVAPGKQVAAAKLFDQPRLLPLDRAGVRFARGTELVLRQVNAVSEKPETMGRAHPVFAHGPALALQGRVQQKRHRGAGAQSWEVLQNPASWDAMQSGRASTRQAPS